MSPGCRCRPRPQQQHPAAAAATVAAVAAAAAAGDPWSAAGVGGAFAVARWVDRRS